MENPWSEHAHQAIVAAVSLWGDQLTVIVRTILIAIVCWGAVALIDARSELAIVRTRQVDVLRRLDANDARIEAGTDDRWRRRDHDAYAAQVSARMDGMDNRMDGQSRVISTLVAKSK